MKEQLQIFKYDEQEIEFDLSSKNVMVNATEMAKVFGKFPANYLESDRAKGIIEACLSYRISYNSSDENPFKGIESEADLVRKSHYHGTWMHRIVALDFAAWLNPNFAVWMYVTIDKIMSGRFALNIKGRQETIRAKEAALKLLTERDQQLKQSEAYLLRQEAEQAVKDFEKKLKQIDKQDLETANQLALELDFGSPQPQTEANDQLPAL